MARRKISPAVFRKHDVASWNFIIFLTLAFILLVVVLNAMGPVGKGLFELRSRAAANCPSLTNNLGQPIDAQGNVLRVESCGGGKLVVSRDQDRPSCLKFVCESSKGTK